MSSASFNRAAPGGSSPGIRILSALLLAIALVCCRQTPKQLVTLRYTYSWNEDKPQTRTLLDRFTEQTGIRVQRIPVPEYTRDYLDLARKLLQDGSGADLLNIDLIWSPTLASDLIDLRPYLADEIPLLEPQLLSSYTVNGKLVAVPFNVPLGGIEYRSDLLREYGYDHPPRTWDELETMAARIQEGERAKGVKDFWGYVWQGGAGEALICNALEWQSSEGGGQIIEPDHTISVNNPAVIRAWQRAKSWIGRISPPSIVAYRELDSMLAFDSGRAAFNRMWLLTPMTKSGQARRIGWRSSPPIVETGFSSMPAGAAGSFGTLGGTGTAISIHSAHRQEDISLLRFQLHAQMQLGEADNAFGNLTKTDFSNPPSLSGPAPNGRILARPSIAAGDTYKLVSGAYIDAVHSVLTGEKGAPEAAAELEKKLIQLTGFGARSPNTQGTTQPGKSE